MYLLARIIAPTKNLSNIEQGVSTMSSSVISIPRLEVSTEQIADICRRYRISELSIFGSVLRDDFRPDSDIDVLVEFEPDVRIGFIGLGRLAQELEAAFGRRVDLGTKRSLREALRDEILASAQVLYAAA
jgi:predicted nucleotidyltransferase